MKDLKSIIRQIGSKRELGTNLPMYTTRMLDLYNKFSKIKFAMNYYTVNEVFEENEQNEYILSLFERLSHIAKSSLIENDNSDYEARIKDIRAEIIDRMEVVTSFIDKFQIYEYVLNRIEYRYDTSEFSSEYYENRFTNDIIHYIIKDKETVNAKISEIIPQLPIRITKTKFYERINEAFSLYKGGAKDSFDEFVYMIRTVSMLYEPVGFANSYPDLYDILCDLQKSDFKELSHEDFSVLNDKLKFATDKITKISDVYVMLEELVNDLFSIIISKDYALNDDNKINNLDDAIKAINSYALKETDEIDISYITDLFTAIEGKQEDTYNIISSSDHIIDEYKNNVILDELNIKDIFEKLNKLSKLTSNSIFIKLEDIEIDNTLDNEYIETTFNSLVKDFDSIFENVPVIIRRAIMSNVMGKLPNFFKNIDELQSYINISLSQCNDIAERRACVSLIKQILE